MNRVSLLAAAVLMLSACGAPEEIEPTEPERIVTFFEGGRAILGNGSEVIEDVAFVVDNGIITAIGPVAEIEHPPGAERYDLSDHTAVPFLHNMHGHVGYLDRFGEMSADQYTRDNILVDLDRYLYYGVGTVAVLGSDRDDTAVQIRAEQQSGVVTTTRLMTAGRGITVSNGFPLGIEALSEVPYQVASGDEARAAVQELATQGVDFVKIWVDDDRKVSGQVYRFGQLTNQYSTVTKLSPALYGVIIDEAHQNNLKVVAHVRYLADAKGLVDAGIDGFVHSIRDRAVDNALIQAMLENDVFYVPTLTAHESTFIYADEPAWLREGSLRESVSGAIIGRLSSRGIVGTMQQNPNLSILRGEFETAMENFKVLYDAGVAVGLGTDSGGTHRFPGFFEHRELELMVQAGLTPLESITVGTQRSGQLLGLEDTGTLEVGMRGDFIIVPGDPITDVAATRNIAEVFRGGVALDRSTMMSVFTTVN
jgi:imidazolonepropionase-like amidohydrolase